MVMCDGDVDVRRCLQSARRRQIESGSPAAPRPSLAARAQGPGNEALLRNVCLLRNVLRNAIRMSAARPCHPNSKFSLPGRQETRQGTETRDETLPQGKSGAPLMDKTADSETHPDGAEM